MIEPRLAIGGPFREAAFAQQHQQLHKQNLPTGNSMHIRLSAEAFHLADDLSHLLQSPLINPPVREIVALLLLRQRLADAVQKAKRIRRAIEHVGQAQVIGMFIKMAIAIANKTDRAAADGIGLAVENVDPRPVLDDNNFMEIVVMLRKRRLREAWLNGNSRSTGR